LIAKPENSKINYITIKQNKDENLTPKYLIFSGFLREICICVNITKIYFTSILKGMTTECLKTTNNNENKTQHLKSKKSIV